MHINGLFLAHSIDQKGFGEECLFEKDLPVLTHHNPTSARVPSRVAVATAAHTPWAGFA